MPRWDDWRVVKFRYNAAAAIAALVAVLGAVPLATARWYLLPILLVPLAVAAGAWRAGTDASPRGLRVRALLGSRFVPWSRIERLAVGQKKKVYMHTVDGTTVPLPAVRPSDLPRVFAVIGGPAT
jgi:hypothetical protein